MGNANHEEVNRGFSKMPLRAVDDDLVGRPLWKQVQKQDAQRRKIDLVSGEKALNAPVIGLS